MKAIQDRKPDPTTHAHLLALRDTLVVLFFTLLPLLFGMFQMKLNTNWQGLDSFYSKGEFFLYAMSLLVSSYQVYNHFQFRASDLKSTFAIISVVLIVVCSGFYAMLTTSGKPDIEFVRLVSFTLISVSLPLFYYAQFVTSKRSPNVAIQREDESDEIANNLG
jgi:hypothetical protein